MPLLMDAPPEERPRFERFDMHALAAEVIERMVKADGHAEAQVECANALRGMRWEGLRDGAYHAILELCPFVEGFARFVSVADNPQLATALEEFGQVFGSIKAQIIDNEYDFEYADYARFSRLEPGKDFANRYSKAHGLHRAMQEQEDRIRSTRGRPQGVTRGGPQGADDGPSV